MTLAVGFSPPIVLIRDELIWLARGRSQYHLRKQMDGPRNQV